VEHGVFHFKNFFFLESSLGARDEVSDARRVNFFILTSNEDRSDTHELKLSSLDIDRFKESVYQVDCQEKGLILESERVV
jgi:hypothetical protein